MKDINKIWNRACSKCGQFNTYHLMMAECDDCINISEPLDIPVKYISHKLGILVLNPEWVRYQEILNNGLR